MIVTDLSDRQVNDLARRLEGTQSNAARVAFSMYDFDRYEDVDPDTLAARLRDAGGLIVCPNCRLWRWTEEVTAGLCQGCSDHAGAK
jgi:hypothetical protein